MERESVAAVKTNPSSRVMAALGPTVAGRGAAVLSMAMTPAVAKKMSTGKIVY
jgi:hypothetical protein